MSEDREHCGSVVECLTPDRGVKGSSLTGIITLCPWARHINPSLVLVQPRKTRPEITERLLMGLKESNQRNKIINYVTFHWVTCNFMQLANTPIWDETAEVHLELGWPYSKFSFWEVRGSVKNNWELANIFLLGWQFWLKLNTHTE